MTDQQIKEYAGHIRGAATFILLKQPDPPMNAQMIAELYPVALEKIDADIAEIVEREHAKAGGVFEQRLAAQTGLRTAQ